MNSQKYYKILKKSKLDLTKCSFILIRQDPPFNLEYITTSYILDIIKNKVIKPKAKPKVYLNKKWQTCQR